MWQGRVAPVAYYKFNGVSVREVAQAWYIHNNPTVEGTTVQDLIRHSEYILRLAYEVATRIIRYLANLAIAVRKIRTVMVLLP